MFFRKKKTPNSPRLGDRLVIDGLLTSSQLKLIRCRQEKEGGRLVKHVVEMDFIAPEALVKYLKSQKPPNGQVDATLLFMDISAASTRQSTREFVALVPLTRKI